MRMNRRPLRVEKIRKPTLCPLLSRKDVVPGGIRPGIYDEGYHETIRLSREAYEQQLKGVRAKKPLGHKSR